MSRLSDPARTYGISLFFTGFPGNSRVLCFGRAGLTASFRSGRSCVLSPGTAQAPSQQTEATPRSWCPSPVCWSRPGSSSLCTGLGIDLFRGKVVPGWFCLPFPPYTQPSSFWICLLSCGTCWASTFAFISRLCSC